MAKKSSPRLPSRVRPLERPKPPFRKLRVYSVDPMLATNLHMRAIRETILKVEWEEDLKPGPVGEYLEVIDIDPASKRFYPPVDLNDAYVLAMDGLPVSEGSPTFHQQMVYAVAMNTIKIFERALGRVSLWSPLDYGQIQKRQKEKKEEARPKKNWKRQVLVESSAESLGYVQRLRIHPHALRQPNAYYSPEKKALLFGYFQATDKDPQNIMPGAMTFGCLSFDVIAHETTHALLDGLHRRYIESTNLDSLAFHEAFADIVALFQHFSLQDVVRHQIAQTRGDLQASGNLLGQLAVQFGQASGFYGALRNYIAKYDEKTNTWSPLVPTGRDLDSETEAHRRGAVLVAAVFDAFLNIYRVRTADLVRIASEGSGILRPGELHPDLVNRLADEASKAAGHVLNICIRALDYCPPVDITFGEYLQAIITADFDLVSDDPMGYRAAFIEAFRRRGIYPRGIRTLSEESLRWAPPDQEDVDFWRRTMVRCIDAFAEGTSAIARSLQKTKIPTRERVFRTSKVVQTLLHQEIEKTISSAKAMDYKRVQRVFGIDLEPKPGEDGPPKFEIHAARVLHRVGPDGQIKRDVVIEITQRVTYEKASDGSMQKVFFKGGSSVTEPQPGTPEYYLRLLERSRRMTFRGGATLLVDMVTGDIRYSIYKSIVDKNRLERQTAFVFGNDRPKASAYFGDDGNEPFAMVHSSE